LPAFHTVFGSYIFVSPALRGRGLGVRIMRRGAAARAAWSPRPQLANVLVSHWPLPAIIGTLRWPAPASGSSRQCGRCSLISSQAKSWPVDSATSPCARAHATLLPARAADVYPCALLWPGRHASLLAATPQELRCPGGQAARGRQRGTGVSPVTVSLGTAALAGWRRAQTCGSTEEQGQRCGLHDIAPFVLGVYIPVGQR